VASLLLGVNLKLYFGYAQTLSWCAQVAELASRNPAVADGEVDLFVLPAAPALVDAVKILAPAGIRVGAQNMYWAGAGAFTGEIDAAMLAEVGCDVVVVGHAERRALFGETDRDVALKVAAAVDGGLTPLICVGEKRRLAPDAASVECVGQLERALSEVSAGDTGVVIAYEPVWAIGAEAPADAARIRVVCAALETFARSFDLRRSSIIYGGTAGPGLWFEVRDVVDGLFLGRRAHDPADLEQVLGELAGVGAGISERQ
jgi:triosephosphate isomerase